MNLRSLILILVLITLSCTKNTIKIENINKGQLKATKTLEVIETKKILLDSNTAPSPQYTQMFEDTITGINYFTFLNTYNHTIYFYDYKTLEFKKSITYGDRKGPNGILKPTGYHIKTMDSIYIYDRGTIGIFLTNNKSEVISKKSLIGGADIRKSQWVLKYPQYFTRTATPFIETKNKLLLTGQSMFFIPETIINKFKVTAYIDYNMDKVNFNHSYPSELYGSNYNWDDQMFTAAFSDLHASGNKLIYSFPVSHDLYISDLNKDTYHKVYGGSNRASAISSMSSRHNKNSREKLLKHALSQDLYASIKYDKYQKVYYRFIRKAISDATVRTSWKDKEIGVIIMDLDFKYLGEVVLGTGREWYWQNSFVTEEGLNIEYLDKEDIDEVALTLKIFRIKNL